MLLANSFPDVTVTNTGDLSGEVVVLGFVTSSHPRFPRQKLFDFQRVGPLAPGESVAASLQLPRGSEAETLAVMDDHGQAWLEPAQFTVSMGDVVAPAVFDFILTVGGTCTMHARTCAFFLLRTLVKTCTLLALSPNLECDLLQCLGQRCENLTETHIYVWVDYQLAFAREQKGRVNRPLGCSHVSKEVNCETNLPVNQQQEVSVVQWRSAMIVIPLLHSNTFKRQMRKTVAATTTEISQQLLSPRGHIIVALVARVVMPRVQLLHG